MDAISKIKFHIRQFPFISPRKIIYSCQDWINKLHKKKGVYFSQRGPWFKTIAEESFLSNNSPQTIGRANPKAFDNNRNYPTGKLTLFYLQNVYLFGHKGIVLTIDHQVFQEFTHHFGIATLKKFFRKNPFYTFTRDARKIEGIGAVLVSPESHNYYHWLNDVLPRIYGYQTVLNQVDHFCISSAVPAKFLDILPAFGIPKEKILLINEREKLRFDHLYVTSLPGSEGRSPRWAIDYIREKLVKGAGEPAFKKLYFKRGNIAERRILNEDALIVILKNAGFEIIDPGELAIDEQVAIVENAKIIIGAHGAALSNLIFAQQGTAVIEVFSPDYFRTDCFYTLSAIRKLNYWYLPGNKPQGANWGDIVVNEQLLADTIKLIDGK